MLAPYEAFLRFCGTSELGPACMAMMTGLGPTCAHLLVGIRIKPIATYERIIFAHQLVNFVEVSLVVYFNKLCGLCSLAVTICPAPCKWWLELPPRAFSFEVTARVGDAGHRTPSVCQVWSLKAFPFRRYRWFSVTALSVKYMALRSLELHARHDNDDVKRPVTSTFVLSTSIWGHWSPVSWASFPGA